MSAFLDENTQFVDDGGKPLAGGKAYFGVVGSDPILFPIQIFSDRALKIELNNPQTLDADGRTENKIWISTVYSLLVQDVLGVQHIQQLDQGTLLSSEFITLTVTGGANDLIADGVSPIELLSDKGIYVLQTINPNSGPMTLEVGMVTAKDIKLNLDQDIQEIKVKADQTMLLAFNESLDIFEWINPSDKIIYLTRAVDVTAVPTTPIWITDGNFIHVVGADIIVSFGDSQQAGAIRKIIWDAGSTITDNAAIIVPGGANLITGAGDSCEVIADSINPTISRITQYQRGAVVPFDGQVEIPWTFVTVDLNNETVPVTLLSGLSNINSIDITVKNWNHDIEEDRLSPIFQLVTTSTITGGYDSRITSYKFDPEAFIDVNNSSGFNIADQAQVDGGDQLAFEVSLKHFGNNVWNCTSIGRENSFNYWGSGQISLGAPLTGLVMEMIGSGGKGIDGGSVNMRYR